MEKYIYQKMSNDELLKCLDKCNICILATVDDNKPYLVSVYFNTYKCGSDIIFKIESKNTGRKIKNIANNKNVCIFIQYNDYNYYKTILCEGIAQFYNYNKHEKKDMFIIEVCIKNIEGRVYYK